MKRLFKGEAYRLTGYGIKLPKLSGRIYWLERLRSYILCKPTESLSVF
ncbi:MAG: hypothetical protein LBJ00_15225 [Planctomycetaceae bacterium]|nr:hypothetical protein [Planctomycetaceae bacterium]